jgi:hypothetical protein
MSAKEATSARNGYKHTHLRNRPTRPSNNPKRNATTTTTPSSSPEVPETNIILRREQRVFPVRQCTDARYGSGRRGKTEGGQGGWWWWW